MPSIEHQPETKPLSVLLEGAYRVEGTGKPQATAISGLCVDSRETKPGFLFGAMPGSATHGAEFAGFAMRMDAAAIITDEAGWDIMRSQPGVELHIPVIVAEDARRMLALAARNWFGRQPETMIAVTGTNGKTSIANFALQIWEHLGLRAVAFGTAGVHGAVTKGLSHTTPEPITLHRLLAHLADEGVTHAAMEASSHGLAQRRLDGVRIRAAGYTNLSRDHLDYHADMEDYFQAKAGLFDRLLPSGAAAVVNLDDAFSDRVLRIATERRHRLIGIGEDERADFRILSRRFDSDGQDLRFSFEGMVHLVRLPLIGGFQAHNALMAAGLAIGAGEPAEAVIAALPHLKTVRGRMQLAATRSNGARVFVDYAHTPEALSIALEALRPHVMGRLVVVFGAGGDRDKGKRPQMGAASAAGADIAFVTDDNPRNEDPASIRAQVMQGCPDATEIGDRAEAILSAVDVLQPGDALLIAGKGHETGQIVAGDILPFDDVEQASIAVAALEGREI